jgi:hypothetical protein
MEHEYTTATEKFDAMLARQRATARATCDELLCAQRAEFEQHYAALRHELLGRIDNELGPIITTLRRELAAARTEIDRLRALQPADDVS